MRFINTKRFSPVALGIDMPLDGDLFYFQPSEIPDNLKEKERFFKIHQIDIDQIWWNDQLQKCMDGIYIENAVEKGGDAIIDGRDAIWNDTDEPMPYVNPNFNKKVIISPHSVYLNDADIEFTNRTVYITGRHYFYLNFWKIMGKVKGQKQKDYINPRFIDMDYLKFARIRMMYEQSKDNTEAKARQLGFSETSGGGLLGYNYSFLRSSENVIVAGNDEDMHNLFIKTRDGLSNLKNTQFYKETTTDSIQKHRLISKWYRSKLLGFTAGSSDQVLSRLSPTIVVYEEVGKWEKGLVKRVIKYVEPSIQAENERTGFQYFIGTGGDMLGGAADLETMHYKSHHEKFLRFRNKFEREKLSKDQYSGWFSAKSWFRVVDNDGNSQWAKGIESVNKEISLETDAAAKHLSITQNALYAQEAFMMSIAGFFGEHKINLLNARLSQIRLHKDLQIEKHGILKWKDPKNPFDGVIFVERSKEESFITIVEEPILDQEDVVYRGLYEAGIDSYDQDESKTTTSKGALVIRKKFLNNNTTYNTDIALLLERPETKQGGKNKFYEHCAMAGIWCGHVEMMIEHTKVLIIEWLISNGFENLIAMRPRFAFAAQVNKSNAMNRYGVDGSMKPNVMAIMSNDLSDEFIANMYITEQIKAFAAYQYSPNYNCDITVASAHAAIAAKENDMVVAYSLSERELEKKFTPTVYKRVNGRISTR